MVLGPFIERVIYKEMERFWKGSKVSHCFLQNVNCWDRRCSRIRHFLTQRGSQALRKTKVSAVLRHANPTKNMFSKNFWRLTWERVWIGLFIWWVTSMYSILSSTGKTLIILNKMLLDFKKVLHFNKAQLNDSLLSMWGLALTAHRVTLHNSCKFVDFIIQ